MLNFVLSLKKQKARNKSRREDKNLKYGRCDLCGGELVKLGEKIIGTTTYVILKCSNCNREVARDMENLKQIE
jgi:DNA-directed RNA polymerase subunit RPC12/RpoP